MQKYKIYRLLEEISLSLKNKIEFPKKPELNKEFYDLVHEIGFNNITACEKIIDISTRVLDNLEKCKDQFSQQEYKIIKSSCETFLETEQSEINFILDLLVYLDNTIKSYKNLVKNPHNLTELERNVFNSAKIDLNIFEIDVI